MGHRRKCAPGSFIGSLLGGWLADEVGFNSISWMAAISAGLGVGLLILVIWPIDRRRYAEQDEPERRHRDGTSQTMTRSTTRS